MKLEQKLRRLTLSERRRIIELVRVTLERDDKVLFAYLHGSILEEGPVRDVDIAVWLRKDVDPLKYILEEGLDIEKRIRLPVDIQVLNTAPITFRYVVYTRGVPIVVKDIELHDMEVAKTLLMYSDLLMLRRKDTLMI